MMGALNGIIQLFDWISMPRIGLPAFTDKSLDMIEPPELLATHLYVAQWTSCRNAPVSNFGKYNVPFPKTCRICINIKVVTFY